MRQDPKRLQILKGLAILDTAPEVVYDDITRTLAHTFQVPIAMVNLLDSHRDWFKSCIGLPFGESPSDTSFCEVFFDSAPDIIIVENTLEHARFATHPLVTGAPFIRFYAAARLEVDGHTLGTLCVYDTEVKQVSASQVDMLKLLAGTVVEALGRRPRPPTGS